tara:strand:+ start:288 stop:461 length:174 start_codon:yes stop_codon:yes gene_type:complete
MVLPGMSDGREFTNWHSSCKMNQEIMKSINAKDDSEYREKLQHKEVKICDKCNKLKI